MQRRIAPFSDLLSLYRLTIYLRKNRPDIVHSLTPKGGMLGMLAAWIARVPIRIAMFNGELKLPNRIVRGIVKITNWLTCLLATHLNADGYGTKEYVESQHITRKPVVVFWHGNINGIDLKKFAPAGSRDKKRKILGISPTSIVFVFVGRVVHDKGIDELVPAFLTLVRQGANARLLIIGKEEFKLDPISPETKSLIDQSPEIMAVGMQSNIPEWLEVADVFVLPSHREGCNCSILEAAAMGLPSISSNIRGCNEVVQNGKTGILISSGNIQELSEAMFKLYAHKELRTTMGHQAREYAHTNYDRQDVWRELRSFYRKISSTSQEIIQ